jgi:hypothetical protein
MYTSKKYLLLGVALAAMSSCIRDEHDLLRHATPTDNFNLLWKVVDESYCYFDYKNINWDSVKTVYAPKISDGMSDRELFDVCAAMLRELKDGHVNLYSDFNLSKYGDFFLDYPQNYNNTLVVRNYLKRDYATAGGVQAQRLHGDVGYLRYATCTEGVTAANIRGALEHITQQGDIKGLIIDVRDNGGGALEYANGFAAHFFSEKTVVTYMQYKEGPGHSDFSKFYPQYVKPDGAAIFSGNIVVLTNRMVFSAANEFVATMKRLPNVTLIGDKTGGGGGLPFSAELYNGWQVRTSRNPLFDANKQHIEFGIEPDIRVDMDKDDEYNGVDTIIEEAIDYLNK